MKRKDYLSILFVITFLFLQSVDIAISYDDNDSITYPKSRLNGEARANSPFFSKREVQSIILEGKKALFVERDIEKARKFLEVALLTSFGGLQKTVNHKSGVDVASAIACYLLGVIELEEGNLEAAKVRFRQAHELVNASGAEQSKFNPVASPFNSGILSQHTQFNRPTIGRSELNNYNLGSSRDEVQQDANRRTSSERRGGFSDYIPPGQPQTPLPLENQWISVKGTPMNVGQDGAVMDSDGVYLPALVKFPSKYRVLVYSQDGWNISVKEGTSRGWGYSGSDDLQTVRKWRENDDTIYSFPPNSTYRIKVEPNNKSNTSLYIATLAVVAVAGWLVIR